MDVTNVAVQLGLQPGKRHENGIESIKVRVQDNRREDGIRLYIELSTATENDFCLIIITPLQEETLSDFRIEV